MNSARFAEATHGFSNVIRWKPQIPAPTLIRTAMAAVTHSSHLEVCVMHRTSGKVNKIAAMSFAEVQKSSTAVSMAIAAIIANSGVRFIRHRNG